MGWGGEDGLAGGVEGVAPCVGEHDAGGGVAGVVGVAGDVEGAVVVAVVVVGAEGDEVGGFGGAAVFPVADVVDFESGGAAAARDGAAAVVAVFDGAA